MHKAHLGSCSREGSAACWESSDNPQTSLLGALDYPWSVGWELTLPRCMVLPALTHPLHPWERWKRRQRGGTGHVGSLPGLHQSRDGSWRALFPTPALTGSATERNLGLIYPPACSSASASSLLGHRVLEVCRDQGQAELSRLCPMALLADPMWAGHRGYTARASWGNR